MTLGDKTAEGLTASVARASQPEWRLTVGVDFIVRADFEHEADAVAAMQMADAAPCMYSALKALAGIATEREDEGISPLGWGRRLLVAADEARAAIAEAEGRNA